MLVEGALSLVADGDLTIEEGVLFSAKGGDGRTNGYQWDHGGGGSGGAISLKGKNVYNRGLVQVNGGNRGAGGGRVVFAADGEIERGRSFSGFRFLRGTSSTRNDYARAIVYFLP